MDLTDAFQPFYPVRKLLTFSEVVSRTKILTGFTTLSGHEPLLLFHRIVVLIIASESAMLFGG